MVELVVAERGGIEAEQIGNLVDGYAAEDGGDGAALDKIAGVEEDAAAATLAFAADRRGEVGEAATPVRERGEAGMQVVGMEDGEPADRGGWYSDNSCVAERQWRRRRSPS
ncbi:MAG TPA: hypothetical protein VKX45_24345 [Bryobacteraceae bacterium]|jgi:hypothetical protein|nr:hypothetical protein [Bryobacteraceae bacterium]